MYICLRRSCGGIALKYKYSQDSCGFFTDVGLGATLGGKIALRAGRRRQSCTGKQHGHCLHISSLRHQWPREVVLQIHYPDDEEIVNFQEKSSNTMEALMDFQNTWNWYWILYLLLSKQCWPKITRCEGTPCTPCTILHHLALSCSDVSLYP